MGSKMDILAFGAHPDDVELGCGATLSKEIALGRKVAIIDLTRGELGTRGTAEIRDVEAAKAAQILGTSFRHNLGFSDGFFTNDSIHQLEIIRYIRYFRPQIVIANAIDDRHIDHGKASKLVSDACFLSGLSKIETRDLYSKQRQDAWRPVAIYHYIQWKNITPDFVVDVTGYIDKKLDAVKAYASQIYNPSSSEPETPISSKNFLESITYRAQDLGRLIDVGFGEGFTVERYLGINTLFDLI